MEARLFVVKGKKLPLKTVEGTLAFTGDHPPLFVLFFNPRIVDYLPILLLRDIIPSFQLRE